MPLVVGVTFRRVGKVYYFDPGDLELHEGDFAIAETARGVEFGEVVLEPRHVPDEELVAPLKKIYRVATGEDLERETANRDKEKHAYDVCDRKIAEHNLPMKLLDAEYAFDGSQVTFSFSADGRVDFRELVKDVAGALKTKVQLHQIGVRDEAKLIGGYGGCGRPLCCATFLSNFEPISMKMAKDQSLFLNPAKFSGVCGKLMCCLRYEHEHYKLAQKRLPSVGAIVQLETGKAKVVDVNVISNSLTVQTEDEVILHVPAAQLHLEGICRRHGVGCCMTEKHCQPLVADDDAPVPDDLDEEIIEDDVIIEPTETIEPGIVSVMTAPVGVKSRTPHSNPPPPSESRESASGSTSSGDEGSDQQRDPRNRDGNGNSNRHNSRNRNRPRRNNGGNNKPSGGEG